MSKWTIILMAVAVALVPSAGSAQEIGVSFQVRERPAQPALIAMASGAAAADVPAGWAYSVDQGAGRMTGGARLDGGNHAARPVVVPASVVTAADRSVTVTFVPL